MVLAGLVNLKYQVSRHPVHYDLSSTIYLAGFSSINNGQQKEMVRDD